jgi:hypothetical protein
MHPTSILTAIVFITMLKALQQMIADGDGLPSTMRVLVLIIVIPIMVVWSILSIKKGDFIIPDPKILYLVATAIGGKAVQSFAENLHPTNPPAAPAASTNQTAQ